MTDKRSPKNQRLDARVLELGLFPSRQSAQAAIMDGGILVNGEKITKPGAPVGNSATIEVSPGWGAPKYVSRGGLKLEKALDDFSIDPTERICLDIGASTGGFTDCLLQHGARLVYAVDVGYGQLDWKLRNDPRVVVKERINARSLSPQELYGASHAAIKATLATIDVSFISVLKILPALKDLLDAQGEVASLLKPQFEAGKSLISKGGVVRSPEVHINVLERLLSEAEVLGFHAQALTFSPLKGPAGNIEVLVHWKPYQESNQIDVSALVLEAHYKLGGTQS
jgi:23S rRNA (cytidine1920-2'-O)/16S rRNA (cytidine1409-2'-O)-methyltransferase